MHSHAWRKAYSNRKHCFSFERKINLSVMGKNSQDHADVFAEAAAALSNLNKGSEQAGDAPSDVSVNNKRLWTYFEMERDSGALTRAKFARCNAELVNLNIDDEKMVQAAALGERLFHREVQDELQRMEQRMDRMEQCMDRMERRMELMEQRVVRSIQIEGARTRNLTLRIAGQPVEPIPFLVGDRPANLKAIQNDDDVAALNTAEVSPYCQGYGFPTN